MFRGKCIVLLAYIILEESVQINKRILCFNKVEKYY